MADRPPGPKRLERVLARPMTQAGIRRAPGETVELRPDQIERLEPGGYFRPAPAGSKAPEKRKDRRS